MMLGRRGGVAIIAIIIAAATVLGFEHVVSSDDVFVGPHSDDLSSYSFVELGATVTVDSDVALESAAAGSAFPAASHFATLTPHLTYEEAAKHCADANKKWTLCTAATLCEGGETPIGGVRDTRQVVPVKDGANKWISIGSDRTCVVRDGGKWGTTPVYKSTKGLVACCNPSGEVKTTTLSRWEGFLVKMPELTSVWMVENGVRRGIPSAKTFEAMGFHWPRIKVLSRQVIESIPNGPPLPDINGPPNSKLFKHALLGQDHDGGNPFQLYEGYLIKKAGSSIICMVAYGSKRCIPDVATFEAFAFEYKLVQVIDGALYDSFPVGVPFSSRVGAAAGSESYVHPLLGKDHFGTSNLRSTLVGTKAFVNAATRRMLDRQPTAAEETAYLATLRANRAVPDLIVKLSNSNTFLTKHVFPSLVQSLYQRILDRKPTVDESNKLIEHFRKVRRSGDTTKNLKQVVLKFIQSKEHMDRFVSGLEDRNMAVKNLYRHLLGREPESTKAIEYHVNVATQQGWPAAITGFIDSPEYKSNVGRYGVPGDAGVYAPAIRALYKKLLNKSKLSSNVVARDSKEVAKDGWPTFVEEFIKTRAYIEENGPNGFLDAEDKIITLKEKVKLTK